MPVAGRADGFLHHGAQSALIDVAHGEGAHAGFAHVRLLHLIHVAQPDNHRVLRRHLRLVPEHVRQLRGTDAHDASERHAVDVAARAALGRVHIGVRVEPDEPDLFAAHAEEARDAAHRSHGHGMIAAQHQRRAAFCQRIRNLLPDAPASCRNLRKIFRVRMPLGRGFRLIDWHVAEIGDFIT